MQKLTIATRGSRLALWQAEHIKALLTGRYPDLQIELLVLKTKGDIILDVPLSKVGGKGLFVKEIEEALLDGRADLAVHSMKDVPMELPTGLKLGVVPQREDHRDMLLAVKCASTENNLLDALPHKASVGTSSLRRQAQLLALRPDLEIISLRGNVDTRLRKLSEGQFDAIIMAAAGLKRLGLSAPCEQPLDSSLFLPACGQGALGLEYAENRSDLAELIGFLEHEPTRLCVTAERAFLAALEGGCQTPIAALAHFDPATRRLALDGLVTDLAGQRTVRRQSETDNANPENATALGRSLAETIKNNGGAAILEELQHIVL
ncbi:MAG: hydroxymethylbilane synthase [Deltaproteobacteria bacterium]|nr:hydroxymethylbilane synthase [Deltaproteobacteria bacterium]